MSALVARYLERFSCANEDFDRLEAMQRRVQAEITNFRASDRLGRDEVHERALR